MWFGLCCLVTPGLSKASCMTILFLNLQITISGIRPHIKWAVSLVIAYGQFILLGVGGGGGGGLCGYVWVNFITPEGGMIIM